MHQLNHGEDRESRIYERPILTVMSHRAEIQPHRSVNSEDREEHKIAVARSFLKEHPIDVERGDHRGSKCDEDEQHERKFRQQSDYVEEIQIRNKRRHSEEEERVICYKLSNPVVPGLHSKNAQDWSDLNGGVIEAVLNIKSVDYSLSINKSQHVEHIHQNFFYISGTDLVRSQIVRHYNWRSRENK